MMMARSFTSILPHGPGTRGTRTSCQGDPDASATPAAGTRPGLAAKSQAVQSRAAAAAAAAAPSVPSSSTPAVSRLDPEEYVFGPVPSPPAALLTTFLLPVANRACTPLDLSLFVVDAGPGSNNNISKLNSQEASSSRFRTLSSPFASSSSSASCSSSPSSSLSSTVLLSSPCSPTSPVSPSTVLSGPASVRRRYLSMSPVAAAGEMTGLDAAAPRPAAHAATTATTAAAADAAAGAAAGAGADADAADAAYEYGAVAMPGASTTGTARMASAGAAVGEFCPAVPAMNLPVSDKTPTPAKRKGSRLTQPVNGLLEGFISLPSWTGNPTATARGTASQQRHELLDEHGDRQHERQRLQDQATPRPLSMQHQDSLHRPHSQPLQPFHSWPQQPQGRLPPESPPISSISSLRQRVEVEFNDILQQQQQQQQQQHQHQRHHHQQQQRRHQKQQQYRHRHQVLHQQPQDRQQEPQQQRDTLFQASSAHPRSSQTASSSNTPATVVAGPSRGDLRDCARPVPIPIPKESERKQLEKFSSIHHPKPQLHAPVQGIRPSVHSSVALLEATAERLSLGSSPIGDAIRDLHCELKRSDSKRSAVLAASVQTDFTDEVNLSSHHYRSTRLPSVSTSSSYQYCFAQQLAAHSSPTHEASSINSFNQYVCAPEPPRLTAEFERASIPSRFGPGKSSVRSTRSAKVTLAEIGDSDPVTLDQDAFDQADAVSDLDLNDDETTRQILENDAVNMPNTDEFHQILEGGFSHNTQHLTLLEPGQSHPDRQETSRPTTANSASTYQQAQEAFSDFDGVHCPVSERAFSPDAETQLAPPTEGHRRPPSADNTMPQQVIDPATGEPMIYYPARVPAMLNLPPKLSSKPKTAQRNARRSQILSVMMDEKIKDPNAKRKSAALGAGEKSWLPDPVSDHKNSFAGLSLDQHLQMVGQGAAQTEPTLAGQAEKPPAATPLRRPPKLNKSSDQEKRKSKAMQGDNINAHLRASAFFDFPAGTHEFEIKDGSAMATLDSILDASANAPVSAFTDHVYAGKLGPEVYGKEKKHKPRKPSGNLPSLSAAGSDASAKVAGHAGEHAVRPSGEGFEDPEGEIADDDNEDEEGAETYQGLPTTLLAELQLRKAQQKQRLRVPQQGQVDGMRATLLEMDAVAELQRKSRQNKRVNLAWEGADGSADPNGSDDEDVPLAIIAAMQQGARNMADVDRPFGLMEIRQMEENEPLRARQARLQGKSASFAQAKRASAFPLPSTRIGEVQPPAGLPIITPPSDADDNEREGETLGQRKKRLAETVLPQARPVSGAFSAELLSKFGDQEEPVGLRNSQMMGTNYVPNFDGEEETLGQRRRRLQSEREAREREMSYSNLIGSGAINPIAAMPRKQMSLADLLNEQRRDEVDPFTQQQMRVQAEQNRLSIQEAQMSALRAQMPTVLISPEAYRCGGFMGGAYNDCSGGLGDEHDRLQSFDPLAEHKRQQDEQNRQAMQDAKMAAIRSQMPAALVESPVGRAGGFRGGMYNDASGGLVLEVTQSGTNHHNQTFKQDAIPRKRASMMMMNNSSAQGLNHLKGNGMRDLNRRQSYCAMGAYDNSKMLSAMYGGGLVGNNSRTSLAALDAMPAAGLLSGAAMDRIERWRHNIAP